MTEFDLCVFSALLNNSFTTLKQLTGEATLMTHVHKGIFLQYVNQLAGPMTALKTCQRPQNKMAEICFFTNFRIYVHNYLFIYFGLKKSSRNFRNRKHLISYHLVFIKYVLRAGFFFWIRSEICAVKHSKSRLNESPSCDRHLIEILSAQGYCLAGSLLMEYFIVLNYVD